MIASQTTSDPALPCSSNPLGFHQPTAQDYAWAQPILHAASRMGCEFCFGNIYAWCLKYGTEIAQVGEFFISRSRNQTVHCMPIGQGDLREVLQLLRADAARCGHPLTLYGVTSEDIPRLEAAASGQFRVERCAQDDFDYIYAQRDLAELAGKKYHQKRNHTARFARECPGWSYEEITPSILYEVLAMEDQWTAENRERNPEGFDEELIAFQRSLSHFETFNMRGAVLRENGAGSRIIAFTMGEPLSTTTFCTHYEKAYADYTGTYQMMNRAFAQHSLDDFEFINREEDLGHEGLRKAKLSYHPAILLEKHRVLFV
ncbi:MAG: phosphatidylglycerol lysyltransferase domain-containing protein [Oscillospiraceae bacterium]|nr:phosphatidylglycerol lysyltransferase domain-containing protein [Oscillospiraceae bacterium]